MQIDVVTVETDQDHGLILKYENGERRFFDVEPFLSQKPWTRIREPHVFRQVFVEGGTVAWPGNIDIAPETLYALSQPWNPPDHGAR